MNKLNLNQMSQSLRWFRNRFGNKLTTTQLEILLYIALNPDATIKEIAVDLNVDFSYVSKCIATFEHGYRHKKQVTSVLEKYKDRYSKRLIRVRLSAHGNYIFDQMSSPKVYNLCDEWYSINPAKILYTHFSNLAVE